MVGGYLYPLKTLKVGSNDLIQMYGSTEALSQRLNDVSKSGKPFFITIESNTGFKLTYPVNSRSQTAAGVIMKAGLFTIVIDFEAATAVVSLTD